MRTLLLGDIGNRLDIADAEVELESLRRGQRRSASELAGKERNLRAMERRLNQQALAIQALTRFLIEKEVVSEAELEAFAAEIDAEDGIVDGQLSPPASRPSTGLVIPTDPSPRPNPRR